MLTLKLFSLLLVFLVGLLGGLLPLQLKRRSSNVSLFAIGNTCAGGIFLGVGLIHMLPDASHDFATVLPGVDYPLAPLICGAGFGLFLMLEKILLGDAEIAEPEPRNTEPQNAANPALLNPLMAYSLTVMLSVHSIIAGMALGAERTHLQTLVILAAILAHKGSAAFALGISLQRSQAPRHLCHGIIVFFSCMTPLGIAVGTLLTEILNGRQTMLFTSVFGALAAATFLYVAAMDILSQEFARRDHLWLKFAGFSFGLAVAALVAIWT